MLILFTICFWVFAFLLVVWCALFVIALMMGTYYLGDYVSPTVQDVRKFFGELNDLLIGIKGFALSL